MNSNNRFTIYPSSSNSVSVFPGFQQVWAKKIKFGAQGNKRWSQRKREEALKELQKPLDLPSGLYGFPALLNQLGYVRTA